MIKVGITGGIGAGKSYISALLTQWGYAVFNADEEAKKIMSHDHKVIRQIKKNFGEQAYTYNLLNREYLAREIFNNSSSKAKLNNIVHPAVKRAFEKWCSVRENEYSNNQGPQIVFNEAAILFEIGRYKDFDFTILVTAPEDIKIKRILKRDKSTVEDIKSRMANQWSDDKKKDLASFIINNDGRAEIVPQLEAIIEQIREKIKK